jgi:hypothetical protein
MFTKKISTFVKQAVLAAFIIGAAGPAIAAAQADMTVAAVKKPETILAPHQMGVGCWSDEGYGRFFSCDAG